VEKAKKVRKVREMKTEPIKEDGNDKSNQDKGSKVRMVYTGRNHHDHFHDMAA
jgi:hypothetical protein